jgi:hypothetical protein
MSQITQKNLFGGEVQLNAPQVKEAKTSAPRQFPDLNIASALNKVQANADAVFWLRILQGQYSRSLNPQNKKDYIQTIKDEISIKRGEFTAELAIKNSLLRRFSKVK